MTLVLERVRSVKISINDTDKLLEFMISNDGVFSWRPNSFEGYDSNLVYNMLLELERAGLVVTASALMGHDSFNSPYVFVLNDEATTSRFSERLVKWR